MASVMNYCSYCGTRVEGSKYCPKCGTALGSQTASSTGDVPPGASDASDAAVISRSVGTSEQPRSEPTQQERAQLLDRKLTEFAGKGWEVKERRSDVEAIVQKKVNHTLHLILTLLTLLWGCVWIVNVISRKRRLLSVDESGRVSEEMSPS
jgi:hypothetical protein